MLTAPPIKIAKRSNIGRSNERSFQDRALLEFDRRVGEKCRNGYFLKDAEQKSSEEPEERRAIVGTPELVRDVVHGTDAMRAHLFDIKNATFPCLVQPKINGVRVIFADGALMSYDGKVLSNMQHIVAALDGCRHILDGELYTYGYDSNHIWKLCHNPKAETSDVVFAVFDIIKMQMGFDERHAALRAEIYRLDAFGPILLVETLDCQNLAELINMARIHAKFGFKGTMVRQYDGRYECGKRSYSLLKI